MSVLTRLFNSMSGGGGASGSSQRSSVSGGGRPSYDSRDPETPVELRSSPTKKKTPKLCEDRGHVFIPDRIPALVAELTKTTLATDSEVTELTDLSVKARAAVDLARQSTHDAAHVAFSLQQERVSSLSAEGRGGELLKDDLWSREDFEEQNEIIRRGASEELSRLFKLAHPISLRIGERLSKAAEKLYGKMESEEKSTAAYWGVAFQPSAQLLAVGQLTWRVDQFIPPEYNNGSDPASLLKSIGKLK